MEPKNYSIKLSVDARQHASVRSKGRRLGERRPFVEQMHGDDLHRKTGRWKIVHRILDRARDWYSELVTDAETGTVERACEEPLTQHQGRGSARR